MGDGSMNSADNIELEAQEESVGRATRDPFAGVSFFEEVLPSPSLTTPAAPPVQPKDPDKALVNTALGTLRLNGWYCQPDPSYKSFVMTVKIRTPRRGVIATDSFRVFADNGLLYFEQVVLDLPLTAVTQMPILETLNQINQRSVSSVFVLQEAGIAMRHGMIPRTAQEGRFSVAMMVQTMRQMYHDRRNALSLLRTVVENCGTLDPLAISRAFSTPAAPGPLTSLNLYEAENLANFAGFVTINDGKQVFLSRDKQPPENCKVRLTCGAGFLRGEVVIGQVRNGKHAWTAMPTRLQKMIKANSAVKSMELYQQINAINYRPGLLRVVTSLKTISALNMVFPTDQDMSVEQFKIFGTQLLNYADGETKSTPMVLGRAQAC